MAQHFNISTSAFTKKYCERYRGAWHLIEDSKNPDCMFLKNKSCSIYEARPTQCRTWPFWPEVMNSKSWAKDVVSFCPGVGKGKLISAEVINKNIKLQSDAESNIVSKK
jgi:Fe-S-cluster containining protein